MRAARSATSRRASPPWDRISDTPARDHVEHQALGRCTVGLGRRDRQDQGDGEPTSTRARRAFRTTAIRTCRHRPTMPAPVRSAISATTETARPTPPVPIPRNNWFGVAGGDSRRSWCSPTRTSLTGKIEHEFANNVKVTNTTRYVVGGSLRASDRTAQPRRCGERAVSGNHHGAAQSGQPRSSTIRST